MRRRPQTLDTIIILLAMLPAVVIYGLNNILSGADGALLIILVGKACIWLMLGALLFPRRIGLVFFLIGAAQLTGMSLVEMAINNISMPPAILMAAALASASAFMYLHNRANSRLESLED